jgi:hypothetical protein
VAHYQAPVPGVAELDQNSKCLEGNFTDCHHAVLKQRLSVSTARHQLRIQIRNFRPGSCNYSNNYLY